MNLQRAITRQRNTNNKEGVYPNYEEARANRWKCEKCGSLFGNLPRLRQHKIEYQLILIIFFKEYRLARANLHFLVAYLWYYYRYL
jgi:hypothetical protein